MTSLVRSSFIAIALTLLALPASAQMTMPKSAGHPTAGGMQPMMSDCSAMMQEVMADPIVRKRMMAIMQKHMQQHAAGGSMMTPPKMPPASATKGSNAGGDSSSHEGHHPTSPVATPTP